jgi:hypothetical protein
MAGNPPYGAEEAHARALDRVGVASTERARLHDDYDSAKGTSRELGAGVLLRAASDEVAARERWLHWIEERDY